MKKNNLCNINKFAIIVLLLFISLDVFSQMATIKGKVWDKQRNETLMFANCILRYQTDTSGIFKGVASDTSGEFEFKNIKKRNLILEIQYIGFQTYKQEIPDSLFDGKKEIDLGDIFLELAGDLDMVTVRAQRKRIEVEDDKLTMNIDEGMANMVSNAFDLLRLVPGVMIDNNENLKLNGKSGVAFQYNGRELKLGWEAIKDMLKAMSPEMIDSYELLKNPGVKYDADGTAGIINIKPKKNQNYGINGSVNLSSHIKDEYTYGYRPSARLNYVDDKWIVSAGYSFNENWYGSPAKADSSLRYIWIDNDTTLFRHISTRDDSKNMGHSFNFSASYSLDSSSTLALYTNYGTNKQPMNTNNSPMLMSHNPNYYIPDSAYNTIDQTKYNSDWLSLGLSYVKKLDTLDSKISSDLDFSMNSSLNNNLYQVDYYRYGYNALYNGNLGEKEVFDSIYRSQGYKRITDNDSKDISWRIDYFKPINKQMRFEAGLKTKISQINRDYNSKILQDGEYVNNDMESNNFKYLENINSLYASFTSKFFERKFSVRLGVRLEQTNTRGEQRATDTTIKQNYFNFFPNIRLSYKFKEDNELSLNYSYRIWRPWSESLNPFIVRLSDYSYSTGNPSLKPEGSHNFYLSHSFKYMLFTSVSYSYFKDEISYITTPITNNYNFEHSPLAVIASPINAGHTQNVSLDLSFNKDIIENLYFNLSVGITYSHLEASLPMENIDKGNWAKNLSTNIYFSLPSKWNFYVFWYYVSSSIDAISKSNGFHWFSASAGKSLFEDKLNINVACNWSFNHKSYSESVYAYTISKRWSRAQPPTFNVGVAWKFGKFYQNKQIQKQQLENFDDRKGQK